MKSKQNKKYHNTTPESLDGKEIKNIIVEIFSEGFKENTEILATTNEDFTINHFKTFLQNICTQFNDLNQSKQKEQQIKTKLYKQCQKLKKQLCEKEQDYIQKIKNLQNQLEMKEHEHEKEKKQINFLQQIVNNGKKDIMKENGEKQIDTNENIDLKVQLTDLINHCKNEIKTKNDYVISLKKQVEKQSHEVQEYEVELIEADEEIKILAEHIEKKLNEVEECEIQLKKLNEQNQQLNEQIKQLNKKNKLLTQQQKIQQPLTKKLTQQQIKENELKQPRKISVTTLYVSFVQSYIDIDKNVFPYNSFPVIQRDKEVKHKTKEIKIPSNYNKDVYYYEYTNRKQLFPETIKEFTNISVYFPIPVLKYLDKYSVVFHFFPIQKAFYIQIKVIIGK
ncbi:hypothetical protein QTN25_006924 [Entamoeba marina]